MSHHGGAARVRQIRIERALVQAQRQGNIPGHHTSEVSYLAEVLGQVLFEAWQLFRPDVASFHVRITAVVCRVIVELGVEAPVESFVGV